ncbi:response regulator [Mesonia sp. HuA40]|uniref:response regulator n=1 Tax=Mesonia sp. HuA40 TaxID=2602761 RepID=UPI0011C8CAAF|nr:response regulator [Mesonia sp. HuA40]TXK74212.1 response regulator [Mesonia sp. HuA40]
MKKILLIEDDQALRENTAELLELSGFEVITAKNGKIGLDLAQKSLPQIIVCDIMMPELNGYEVLKALGEQEETKSIPFIFLSAKTDHTEVRTGMNLGADDYLTKPYEEEDLLAAINSRIAKSKLLENKTSIDLPQKAQDLRNLNELKNYFYDFGEELEVKRGKPIYQEGEHANFVFLIIKGVVKTQRMAVNGKELITALYQADDFLGFSSFDETTAYEESATAVENCLLTRIPKTKLKEILVVNKELALELMNVMNENLSHTKLQLLQMAYGSVRKKTAQTILQFLEVLSPKQGETIKISRGDLASVAGIATESLIRTLSQFKKDGLIDIDGRNIKILDKKGLSTVE